LKNLIKGNANRNFKEQAVTQKVNDHHHGNGGDTGNGGNEVSLGPHKLSEEQLRKIYALIDKRDQTVGNKNLPLSSQVKKIEQILDQGYHFEYREDHDGGPGIYNDGTPAAPPPPKTFSERFMEAFKDFFVKKVEQ
jgi:hypothetical protein